MRPGRERRFYLIDFLRKSVSWRSDVLSRNAIDSSCSPPCPSWRKEPCTTPDFYPYVSPQGEEPYTTPNFTSIPTAMFLIAQNYIHQYPLADNYSTWTRVVGIVAAVVGPSIFGMMAGIIGNIFEGWVEDMIERRGGRDEVDDSLVFEAEAEDVERE